jgi:hypothetical protein
MENRPPVSFVMQNTSEEMWRNEQRYDCNESRKLKMADPTVRCKLYTDIPEITPQTRCPECGLFSSTIPVASG